MLTDRVVNVTNPRPGIPAHPADVALRVRGLRALGARASKLAEVVIASLQASEPAYRRWISPAELQMARSADMVLEACRRPPEERMETTAWAHEVGGRRAQQGVPMEALGRAYHIGGQVLFSAFMQWADEEGLPRDRSLIVADDIWKVVDLHQDVAFSAFRKAEEEMSGDGGAAAGLVLDALLNGDADRDGVAAVVRAWGLAEQARYAVVVQRPADWGSPALEQAELPAGVAGVRVIWRVHGGCAVGLAVLGDVPAVTVAGALSARPDRRTGVGLVVDGLAELGRARRLAELAVRTVTGGDGVACLEERLPSALLAARPDLARELCMRVLGPVLELDRVSRDLLLDTLAAWLTAGGSAHRAAATLFCHRNTVLNRVRRLERLTKKSLSVPEELVELALALEAFHMSTGRR